MSYSLSARGPAKAATDEICGKLDAAVADTRRADAIRQVICGATAQVPAGDGQGLSIAVGGSESGFSLSVNRYELPKEGKAGEETGAGE